MRNIVRSIRTITESGEVVCLACPPMHDRTPSWVRVRVFEYVLRRQLGLAQMLAETSAEEIEGIAPERSRLAAMLAQTPHRNARGSALAA